MGTHPPTCPLKRQPMRTHLYASEHGRIVAVDDNDEARDAVVLCRMPPALFDGQPVPYLVAKAWLHERGGLWFRHTGLHRMKPENWSAAAQPESVLPAGATTGRRDQNHTSPSPVTRCGTPQNAVSKIVTA